MAEQLEPDRTDPAAVAREIVERLRPTDPLMGYRQVYRDELLEAELAITAALRAARAGAFQAALKAAASPRAWGISPRASEHIYDAIQKIAVRSEAGGRDG